MRPRRSRQSALAQPASSSSPAVQRQHDRQSGSVTGLVQPASSAARASGVSSVRSSSGDRLARRHAAPLRRAGRARPRRPAAPASAADPSPSAIAARARWRRRRRPSRRRQSVAHGSASSAASVHSGSPSVRQCSPICQRGNGSPGYHLPWLRCTRPLRCPHLLQPRARDPRPAPACAGRRRRWSTRGSTWLSIETNVGSPPIVSRTSPAASRLSTCGAQLRTIGPRRVGVRQRDPRVLVDPRDRRWRTPAWSRTARSRR